MSDPDIGRVNSVAKGNAVHDEDRLVEAARTDRQAFGELYDRYFEAVYNYIARRVGDQQAAEDLTSATWERALAAIERYEVRGLPFAAWLYRIAGNLVANHHRHIATHRQESVEGVAGGGRLSFVEGIQLRDTVERAIGELSESDQEMLSLCYFAGLSPQEMGEILGCSQSAVHKRLHRARARLRKAIDRFEEGD